MALCYMHAPLTLVIQRGKLGCALERNSCYCLVFAMRKGGGGMAMKTLGQLSCQGG